MAVNRDRPASGPVGGIEALAGSAALWDDNPTTLDLLGFSTVVTPILTALTAPGLDPLTMGVYGPWGSGKVDRAGAAGAAAARQPQVCGHYD
jgi:hypothetical protein